MPENTVADISIIVPNYNSGCFLSEFIESIVNSTVLPGELIIIDDGSADESAAVLKQYQHLGYLKVIVFPQNQGLVTALNAGLDAATRKYIMRADHDDVMLPERIEIQYAYMETHPETDVLGCNVTYFHGETGRNINVSNFPADHNGIINAYRRGVNGIQHPTAVISGKVMQRYRYQQMLAGEDYDIFSRMARDGCRFANLREPLYRMRIHPASLTANLSLAGVRNIFEIRDRIWGTRSANIRIVLYFYYIYFYKKYQLSTNRLSRHCFLFLAGMCYPVRLFKRLIRK
ncbi:MAG: glycosyltransferase [Bacteroidetes bacterium]|nr:glycosyltransferase [Bacteroidota bacterium]